jgi:hypothetical protein
MALGGALYIDLTQDTNWDKQIDELCRQILHLIKPLRKAMVESRYPTTSLLLNKTLGGTGALDFSKLTLNTPTKTLKDLTVNEVATLLKTLNLGNYVYMFQERGIDGATLEFVDSEQETVELGITLIPKARMFFNKIQEYRTSGVPICDITSSEKQNENSGRAPDNNSAPTSTTSTTNTTTTTATTTTSTANNRTIDPKIESKINEQGLQTLVKKDSMYSWMKSFRNVYDAKHSTSSTSTTTSTTASTSASSVESAPNVHPMRYSLQRQVTVRGVTGTLANRLNGDYDMFNEENIPTTGTNIQYKLYRKRFDPDIWIEYNQEKECWQIKSTSSRGSKSCLAEKLPSNDSAILSNDTLWMVHDGHGNFVEQPTVKIFPILSNIILFGLSSDHKLATKIHGKYIPTNEVNADHVVYMKHGDIDMCIEYNANRMRWQLKTSSARGGNGCIAEMNDSIDSNMTITPTDVLTNAVWVVTNEEHNFVPEENLKLYHELDSIQLLGGNGTLCQLLNGVYTPKYELCHGHIIYQHIEHPDIFMEYNDQVKKWQIKPKNARGSTSCYAQLASPTTTDNNSTSNNILQLGQVNFDGSWEVSKGDKLTIYPDLHMTPIFHPIFITFSTSQSLGDQLDAYLLHCSGLYKPMDLPYDIYPIYKHASFSHLHYLKYNEQTQKWQLHSSFGSLSSTRAVMTEDKDTKNASTNTSSTTSSGSNTANEQKKPVEKELVMILEDSVIGNYPIEQANGGWRLMNLDVFLNAANTTTTTTSTSTSTSTVVDVRVFQKPPSVHILDTIGPRADLINGLYEPINEVYDNMIVYKKKISTTVGATPTTTTSTIVKPTVPAASATKSTPVENYDISELWIEYSIKMKSWQLKRTADRNSPKAYATIPSIAPIFLEESSKDAVWSVFDTNQKQWIAQAQMKCFTKIYPVYISGVTGSHADYINGQYEATNLTFNNLPLYKKKITTTTSTTGGTTSGNGTNNNTTNTNATNGANGSTYPGVWMEYNKSLRSWQVKAEKDRGQNKAWAYLTTELALRPEECSGTWEVFDSNLKWHSQPQFRLTVVRS